MNIVLGKENIAELQDRYVVLELDTLRIAGSSDPVTAYCLLEKVDLGEMFTLDHYRELHQNLLKNYRLKNWNFCEQALEHLTGHWKGELDSFYENLNQRVQTFRSSDPGDHWDGIIDRAQ